MPVAAAAVAFPDEPRRSVRLGLLQSRQPFIDPHDIAGSRDRAFTAYRVLTQQSIEEHGPLDWLAGGAFPLSGPGPFPEPVLAQLALTQHSAEVAWLESFSKTHQVRLTLGGWWRGTGMGIAYRQLMFDSLGQCRALHPSKQWAAESVQLHMPAHCTTTPSLSGFAAECGRLHRYGAWIEMLSGPVAPPGAPPVRLRGSAIVAPDGGLIAHAGTQAESCLVANLG
jgi:hypothetical protein